MKTLKKSTFMRENYRSPERKNMAIDMYFCIGVVGRIKSDPLST